MNYDIIVIGGGVSGMTAAVNAAASGAKVCIIEHSDRVGKKILATGNGKCNLTNMNISRDCYNSSSDGGFYEVIRNFMPDDLIEFLASFGLYTRVKDGYVYPASEQASAVLDKLRFELRRLGVCTDVSAYVEECRKQGGKFIIKAKGTEYVCRRLIIAAGSKCAPKTGSDGSGYDLAKDFGHRIVSVIPALVQLKCREPFFKELHGVRTDALLSLTVDGKTTLTERGELQLTDYGISGIPVFQMSGFVKRLIDSGQKPCIHIDFCPDHGQKTLNKMLEAMICHDADMELSQALCGILNKKLAGVIIKRLNMKPSAPCGGVHKDAAGIIASAVKNFTVTPYDTNGFENAQTCAGGVRLDEIDFATMESKLVKGLYFAGEILDVDGRCGGYNLHWAFASGRLAGQKAAGTLK